MLLNDNNFAADDPRGVKVFSRDLYINHNLVADFPITRVQPVCQ